MNARFNVTWERINEREACAGDTDRRGMLGTGLGLRDALQTVRNEPPSMSESRGTYASASRHECARWVSAQFECWESGDTLTLSVHFPESVTSASRARLCRFLARAL
jgi:hypothetical protein